MKPIWQAVRDQFGSLFPDIATGARLHHDHGTVYMSDDFLNEFRFIASWAWHLRFPSSGNVKLKGAALKPNPPVTSPFHSVRRSGSKSLLTPTPLSIPPGPVRRAVRFLSPFDVSTIDVDERIGPDGRAKILAGVAAGIPQSEASVAALFHETMNIDHVRQLWIRLAVFLATAIDVSFEFFRFPLSLGGAEKSSVSAHRVEKSGMIGALGEHSKPATREHLKTGHF